MARVLFVMAIVVDETALAQHNETAMAEWADWGQSVGASIVHGQRRLTLQEEEFLPTPQLAAAFAVSAATDAQAIYLIAQMHQAQADAEAKGQEG